MGSELKKMTDRKLIGFQANEDEAALVENLRVKTDESSVSDVLRKAVLKYARAEGLKVPA